MESIINRINQQKFWSFHGGVHPPEQKTLTNQKPIKPLSLPEQLIIPLQQHIGRQGDLLVQIGDHVLKGQPLTKSTNPMAVPVHAPTSGTITAIKHSVIAHPSGLSELCIFLNVDHQDTWVERTPCNDVATLTNQEIVQKIADAGISGMGGAGFPTHIKVDTKPDINFLIINAAECEPYITADDLLMCEHSESIVDGIKILNKLLNPAFILIGIEDNKPKAIEALKKATAGIEKIHVCVVPTKYPAGGEKQLIQLLTGKEIKSGTLPIKEGIIMQNVATCYAISEAILHDTPLIQRVVTVTGQALEKPQNVWALLGTPVHYLLSQCGFDNQGMEKTPVIMGGPMMGFSLPTDTVPVVKTTNCILAPSYKEMPSAFEGNSAEVECIRCGQCADVCPTNLLPQELQWSAKAKDYPQLNKLNLSDCIDCGACAYVCPSHIPLVQYYRIAKAEIRQQQQQELKAEKAKARFEARKQRLEKEKRARELKHKKAAEARKAAMNKATPEATEAKSAVAAALARVKAKKAANQKSPSSSAISAPVETTQNQDNKKEQVAAAIARAKAKKQAKPAPEIDAKENAKVEPSNTDSKKAKIAAAVAKAKAKKSQEKTPIQPQEQNQEQTDSLPLADKKANAIAKAKAKALAKKQATSNNDSSTASDLTIASTAESEPAIDEKNAKKAAVIAKAKAKALAKKNKESNTDNKVSEKNTVNVEPRKVQNISETSTINDANNISDKDAKKAAIIAKAKAKALAKKKLATQSVSEKKTMHEQEKGAK